MPLAGEQQEHTHPEIDEIHRGSKNSVSDRAYGPASPDGFRLRRWFSTPAMLLLEHAGIVGTRM